MKAQSFTETILSENVLVIKDATLMSPGYWKGVNWDAEEIRKAHENTNWDNPRVRDLFLDHLDQRTAEWIGEIKNPHIEGNEQRGDLVIYDPLWIAKLKNGRPKFGISPKIEGVLDKTSNKMIDFQFGNYSLVINPAVKTTVINNSEVMIMSEMTLQDLVKGSGKKEIELGEKEIYETALRILAEHGMHPNMMPDNHPEENEEEKKKKEEEMNRNILASLESLGLAEVQEIAKKAREIQEPGEPWMDAMKRASKMMEEQKMSEQEQARIEALEKKVAEMTAKNDELLKKLDEPDKTKIVLRDDKKIEIPRDVDQGMLDYLKSLGGE